MLSISLTAALFLCASDAVARQPVAEFVLPDLQGRQVRLSDFRDHRIIVVVFLGTKCPLARLYASRLVELANVYAARGVAFVAIDSNTGDSREDVARFASYHKICFPVLFDASAKVADEFGASRQLEVFVLDDKWKRKYHGRVDDRCFPGVQRAEPRRDDLKCALDELLDGKPVTVAETEVLGCFIQRTGVSSDRSQVTYHKDIAPILERCCVECHREGQIGPFSLTSYEEAAAWSATIGERVADGTMPPWHADPQFGNFANERRLSSEEKKKIEAWIAAETPEGDKSMTPSLPRFSDHWNIGTPDKIVVMPESFQIPATGTIENIAVELDPGFARDVWVRGTEVRPGNRAVVHHCTVFIGPPGCKDLVDTGATGLYYFSDFVPGLMPTLLPDGMARRLPAGWHIYLSLHYVTNGSATTDRTSMGLVLTNDVRYEVQTVNILQTQFELKPYEANQRVEQSWIVQNDMLLLSLFPHMHLRGQAFRYEATYPDGVTETLLNVPRYDFMWQHRYILSHPKLLPAGTTLRGIALFDNSTGNRANPDASATVRYGKLTTDEMFHGYFDAAIIPASRSPLSRLTLLTALTAIVGLWVTRRRWAYGVK